eukprot:gene16014-18990_t
MQRGGASELAAVLATGVLLAGGAPKRSSGAVARDAVSHAKMQEWMPRQQQALRQCVQCWGVLGALQGDGSDEDQMRVLALAASPNTIIELERAATALLAQCVQKDADRERAQTKERQLQQQQEADVQLLQGRGASLRLKCRELWARMGTPESDRFTLPSNADLEDAQKVVQLAEMTEKLDAQASDLEAELATMRNKLVSLHRRMGETVGASDDLDRAKGLPLRKQLHELARMLQSAEEKCSQREMQSDAPGNQPIAAWESKDVPELGVDPKDEADELLAQQREAADQQRLLHGDDGWAVFQNMRAHLVGERLQLATFLRMADSKGGNVTRADLQRLLQKSGIAHGPQGFDEFCGMLGFPSSQSGAALGMSTIMQGYNQTEKHAKNHGKFTMRKSVRKSVIQSDSRRSSSQ